MLSVNWLNSMYKSNFLLYIFYTGLNYKIGLVEKRKNLNKRYKTLYKGLQQPDKSIRDRISFARVYEGKTDRMIKTCEINIKNLYLEKRIPDHEGFLTEAFDSTVTLDEIIRDIESQTRCKLNLIHEDYVP